MSGTGGARASVRGTGSDPAIGTSRRRPSRSVTAALWGETQQHADHDLLRLHGTLSAATVPRARTLLGSLLHDRGAVVADLAGLRVRRARALEVFPVALAAAGGWPEARLVLTGADAEVRAQLLAQDVTRAVPFVEDPTAAAERLHRRPQRVARHRDFPLTPCAPAEARTLVREVCADWRVPGAADVAALLASELVSNAVVHARSSCRVTVSLGEQGLQVGVRDYTPGLAPRPRPVDVDRTGGRGLHLVAVLSSAWGVRQHPDGKTMWALVTLPG